MGKKLWIPCLLLAGFSLFTGILKAQTLSSEDIKATLVKEWERAKAYTDSYLETMPANKYNFKAMDSVRSFAQQMIHLGQTNYFLISAATDAPPPPTVQADLEHRGTMQTKDSVTSFVNASYDFAINAVKNLDISKWGEKKTLMKYTETRFALLLKSFEHQTHHRGQTTIYIRVAGLKPPQESLF